MRPVWRIVLVLCLIASAQRSWGQDVVTLLARDWPDFDWSAWELEVSDKTALLTRLIGECPNSNQMEESFHFVDFSGDGVADLVYSGLNFFCHDAVAEGTRTALYHNREGLLTKVAETDGYITGAWQAGPWEPMTFFVRVNGCCGDQRIYYRFLYPDLARRGTMRYRFGGPVYSSWAMEIPEVRFERPRPFEVRLDEYNLRSSPEIDESPGAVLAVYGKGATGMAVGEATGPEGRVWWFVVMAASTRPLRVWEHRPGPGAGDWAEATLVGRYVGWMSSRFLDTLPQLPDSLPSLERWMRPRN